VVPTFLTLAVKLLAPRMFVTIERRTARNQDCGARLIVRLVESTRVGADSHVRRQTVAYLGSIHEKRLLHPLPRQDFWLRAQPIIDNLSLTRRQRATVLVKVERVVPKPTSAEVARERQGLRWFAESMRQMVSRP
jgi:hypothetical protein